VRGRGTALLLPIRIRKAVCWYDGDSHFYSTYCYPLHGGRPFVPMGIQQDISI